MRSLILLSLASTVLSHSPLHKRHSSIKARRIEERAGEAFNFDADAIFPPPLLEKRGLLGGLVGGVDTLLNTILAPLLPSTSTTTAQVPAVTIPAILPTTTAAAPAPTTTAAQGNTQAPANPSPSDTSAVPGATPTTSLPGAANTTPSSNGNSAAAGSGSASSGALAGSNSIVDLHAVPISQVVTDHFGNSLTITAPVTRTWLTTFPNGVVSTMTEVISPTVEVAGNAPTPMAPAKIAAIVGTIVVVFLVTFAVAFAFLVMRKKQKKRIALLDSRPHSIASSFGTASDEYNDERRLSHAPEAAGASVMTFVTAPASVNGAILDFPLPPVPAAESRPGSGLSDNSFEFSQYRKSRASIIEDRNRFRKIGQYPDADSYTPFVLPPSDFGHSDELSPRVSIVGHEPSLESASSASYHTSNNVLLMPGDNPFTDPVTVPQPTHIPVANSNPLANDAARRSTLWRAPTFGPDSKRLSQVASPGRDTISSVESSEYGTALDNAVADHTDSNAPSRHPSTSTGRFSYHSAFEAYIRAASPQGPENPFVDQPLPAVPGSMATPRVIYPAPRPGTSSGGTSIVSSAEDGDRTPDPSELFFRVSSERPRAPSAGSPAPRNSESTIRGKPIAYPALRDATARGNTP